MRSRAPRSAISFSLIAIALVASACTNPQTDDAGGGGDGATGGGGGSSKHFSDAEWATVLSLSPSASTLPGAPIDVSNRYGDDPAAAALGEKLFFETGYSGKLLDIDNDGSAKSLGVRGQSGKVACAGCHSEKDAFLDTRSVFQEISLGTGWTARRTPSLLDVGQAKIVMWGGGRSTLYSQFFGPIENPLEMNSSRLFVAQFIATNYKAEYEAIFGAGTLDALSDAARFPPLTADTTGCKLTSNVDHPRALPPDALYECHGMPGDGAEYDGMTASDQEIVTRVVVNAGKSVAAYQRLLTCGPSRFDAWVHGEEDALREEEQRGLKLFVGKAKCVDCHSGSFMTDQKFHNVGFAEGPSAIALFNGDDRGAAADLLAATDDEVGITSPYSDGDDGRMPEVVGPEYEGAFRTPSLRCVAKRPTFMHSGLSHSLEDVVAFFNRGGDAPGTHPGVGILEPLGLSAQEEAELVAFLKSLDGDTPVPTFR
jgi:cytochrome c peroxidase